MTASSRRGVTPGMNILITFIIFISMGAADIVTFRDFEIALSNILHIFSRRLTRSRFIKEQPTEQILTVNRAT
jgi:hypothetical protein